MLHRLTLDSGRTVELRPLKVSYYKTAMEAAAHRSRGDTTMLAMHSQDEILKTLLVSLDGKKLSAAEKENTDLFDPTEYRQVMLIIEEMVGEAKRPKVEMVSDNSGDK